MRHVSEVHERVKNSKCVVCDMQFTRKVYLNYHLKYTQSHNRLIHDEFQFKSTGSLLNVMEGEEDIDIKLIVGKRLSNRMYINTQIDFRNFNENQYEAVYQLSRNTSIVGGLNSKEGNNSLHLKYRIKYYY